MKQLTPGQHAFFRSLVRSSKRSDTAMDLAARFLAGTGRTLGLSSAKRLRRQYLTTCLAFWMIHDGLAWASQPTPEEIGEVESRIAEVRAEKNRLAESRLNMRPVGKLATFGFRRVEFRPAQY